MKCVATAGTIAVALGAVVCLGGGAQAASECLKLEAPLDRLACYDREAGRTPTTTTLPAVSAWDVQMTTSKLTDDKNIYLTVSSKDPVTCRWKDGQRAYLTIRCQEQKTAIILSGPCQMASSPYHDWGKVEYRVDDKQAKSVSMDESTDHSALGLWRGGQAIPMIKQLLEGKQLIMRYVPFGESPVTSEFNIEGLDEAIKALRAQCKW